MFDTLSLPLLFTAFALASAVVVAASIKATGLADTIADRTRMGEALAGGLILGGATSLAGVVVSVNAAIAGDAAVAGSGGENPSGGLWSGSATFGSAV